MISYFFWDIENVSFHNLARVMKSVSETDGDIKLHVVYSKIKEARKSELIENGWSLVDTGEISRNSADHKIKEMINSILDDKDNLPDKIFLITEDKGFFKISQQVIKAGIKLEIICGTKNPQWIKDLKNAAAD